MGKCYYFVDDDGTEGVCNVLPSRNENGYWEIEDDIRKDYNIVELPPNTIFTLFNIKISYKDDPICIKF
ncbi:MAG: hypothetical protein IKT40_12375 [Bacilli bacterium]|nr:hypothetical protein [Bacilli bacterium]